MPYTLPPITLTENVTSPVNIPGAMGSVTYLKMVNASPYLLQINNLLGGSDYMQPGEANVWPVPGLTTAIQVTPQQFGINPNVIPSSVLVVTWYLEGEQPTGSYPVNFSALSYVGNNVQVNSAATTIERDLLTPFVLSGLVASKNIPIANQLDVTAGIAYPRQSDGSLLRQSLSSQSFLTSAINSVYFLDLNPDGSWSWSTSHSAQSNYLTIAQVTTDGGGNILTVSDERQLNTTLIGTAQTELFLNGSLSVGFNLQFGAAVSGVQSFLLYDAGNTAVGYYPPETGPSAQGHYFSGWTGAGPVVPLSIGGHFNAASSWIDAAGVLHAPAPVTLAAGNQETGQTGCGFTATAAGQFGIVATNYKTVLTNTPTSITLGAQFQTNTSGVAGDSMTRWGFHFFFTAVAAGLAQWYGTYTTVGNCMLAVDAAAGTFEHHCDICGHLSVAAPFTALTHSATSGVSLTFTCPACGAVECFNTQLTSADETDTASQGSGAYATTRGAQATLIRQLMTALGMAVAA